MPYIFVKTTKPNLPIRSVKALKVSHAVQAGLCPAGGSRLVVDIRKGSSYFGKHLAIELSSKNQRQLFIPRGFAHGYACLSQMALLSYKVDSYYNKAAEQSIAFNDPKLAIDWKIPQKLQKLSPKDLQHPTFEAAQHFDNNSPCYD